MQEKPGQGDVGKERKPEWPDGKTGGDIGKKGGGMAKPEEMPKEKPID